MYLPTVHPPGPPPSYSSIQLAPPPPAYTRKSRALSKPRPSVKLLTTTPTPTRSGNLEAQHRHEDEHQRYHLKCFIAMLVLFLVALGSCILVGKKLGRSAIFADIGIIIVSLVIWECEWRRYDRILIS
jgi:hypothetical protein